MKNCPYNNKQYNSRRESSNMAELEAVALISSTMSRSDEWFIDSAATKHMTNDRSILQNYIQYDQPKDIYLGDSTVIHALDEGKVRLPTVNSTYDVVLDLHEVLFVPKLTKNLLSVPAMALMGAEIRFDKDKCLVLKDGKEFVIGCLLHDKLYSVNTIEYAQVSTADSTASPAVWHRRLGHLNYTYMNQLIKKEMVDGMKYVQAPKPRRNVRHVYLAKCRRHLFQSRANTGQPDHMRLYTVMYVVQCKWNQKVVVDTCLHSQMIIHDIRLFTSSNPRVKYFQSSWNMSILLRNILVVILRN